MLIFLPVPPVDPLVEAAAASACPESPEAATASLAPTGGTPLGACLLTPSGYQGTASPIGSHRDRRTVDAEDLAKHAAHFADGRVSRQRGAHEREQIVSALRTCAEGVERAVHVRRGTGSAHRLEALDLRRLKRRVDAQDRHRGLRRVGEPVDPDDDPFTRLDKALVAIRGLLDLLLVEPGLDRSDGTALVVDSAHERSRCIHEVA